MLFCTCPAEYQHVKNKYTVYCQMSLESPSESFFWTGFNFDRNEKKDFDQACCSVLCQILNIVFLELLKKSSPKSFELFYALIYVNFLSKPDIYHHHWIKQLPQCMTVNGENGVSLLLQLLVELFHEMFLRAVVRIYQKYCNHPHILIQTGANVDYVGTDADSQADEAQQFFGWAIKKQ